MAPLTEFVQSLLAEQGISGDLDPEVRAQLESDLTDSALNLVNRRLVEALSERDMQQFSAILDSNPSPQAVQAFIEQHVPNRQHVTTQALVEFRQYYLGKSV